MKKKPIDQTIQSFLMQLEHRKTEFVYNPNSDFTRHRKISFSDCLQSVLCMSGGTLFSELLQYFSFNADSPSVSAYLQQRAKIKVEAFQELFRLTTTLEKHPKTYHGYRLLAIDGSDIHIPTNADDTESYFPGTNGQKPYNLLHLNAMYDILSNQYQDVVLQNRWAWNEADAFVSLLQQSSISSAIVLADRGYESYNLMAHAQAKNWKYLIRIKDITGNGILKSLLLPDTLEFDLQIDWNITRKQSKEVRELCKDRNHYHFLPTSSRFDFLHPNSTYKSPAEFYNLSFRVVRFPISENQYEAVVTNLDPDEFPPDELKKLYSLRWGIETAFRALKYQVGLLYFHSKKKEFLLQELFARMALFNIASALASQITVSSEGKIHEYKVNFSQVIPICKKLLLRQLSLEDAESLLSSSVVPIRNDRKYPRGRSARTAKYFVYRIA